MWIKLHCRLAFPFIFHVVALFLQGHSVVGVVQLNVIWVHIDCALLQAFLCVRCV